MDWFALRGWRQDPREVVRWGMTLVEVLVVVAIVGLLVGLLLPAVQGAREAGRRIACANNLRGLGQAVAVHESARRRFPLGCLECSTKAPRKQLAWNVFILPYVEEPGAAAAFDLSRSYRAVENLRAAATVVPLFLCPSTARTRRTGLTTGDRNGNGRWDPGDGLAYTDYGGMYGVAYPVARSLPEHAGMMQYERSTAAADVADGLSHTVVVAECTGRDGALQSEWANGQNIFDQWWNNPINTSQNNEIWSDHPGSAGVVFGDGHVEYVAESIDQGALVALLTRAAGD